VKLFFIIETDIDQYDGHVVSFNQTRSIPVELQKQIVTLLQNDRMLHPGLKQCVVPWPEWEVKMSIHVVL